jgi:hypothetical protein
VEIELLEIECTRPRDGGVGGHCAVEVPGTVRGGSGQVKTRSGSREVQGRRDTAPILMRALR